MFWADADHVFPADALLRLVAHEKPVVGANYPRRAHPTFPTAESGDQHVWTTADKARAGDLERVSRLGLGLCLMHLSARSTG